MKRKKYLPILILLLGIIALLYFLPIEDSLIVYVNRILSEKLVTLINYYF